MKKLTALTLSALAWGSMNVSAQNLQMGTQNTFMSMNRNSPGLALNIGFGRPGGVNGNISLGGGGLGGNVNIGGGGFANGGWGNNGFSNGGWGGQRPGFGNVGIGGGFGNGGFNNGWNSQRPSFGNGGFGNGGFGNGGFGNGGWGGQRPGFGNGGFSGGQWGGIGSGGIGVPGGGTGINPTQPLQPRVQNPYFGVNYSGWRSNPNLPLGAVPTIPFTQPSQLHNIASAAAANMFKTPQPRNPSTGAATGGTPGAEGFAGNGWRRAATSAQLQYIAAMATREFAYRRRGAPAGMGLASVSPPPGVVFNRNTLLPGNGGSGQPTNPGNGNGGVNPGGGGNGGVNPGNGGIGIPGGGWNNRPGFGGGFNNGGWNINRPGMGNGWNNRPGFGGGFNNGGWNNNRPGMGNGFNNGGWNSRPGNGGGFNNGGGVVALGGRPTTGGGNPQVLFRTVQARPVVATPQRTSQFQRNVPTRRVPTQRTTGYQRTSTHRQTRTVHQAGNPQVTAQRNSLRTSRTRR